MLRICSRLLYLGCVLALASCANINSIGRSTSLPSPGENEGKAVHLDAQQRVLIVHGFGAYCSEPSPDALAAFAASLGLGASVPGTGAGSLAGGQQSSAASIGLRTQSITLMRDALFRMCEAYANGAIGPNQIATLLGRSQDLTAVILAVEQLTGAVAANQVALTGTTSASASASLLSNQSLLDAAREDETRKQAELEEAEANLTSAQEDHKRKSDAEAAAKGKRDRLRAADSGATDQEKDQAQRDWERSEADLQRAQREVDAAENMVDTRETLLEESRRNRETIESSKDSALTAAAAGTTSSGQFSAPAPRNVLSKEATEAIAGAVQGMVQAVLRKEYTEEACMAMIAYIPRDYKDWDDVRKAALVKVQDRCADFVFQSVSKRIEVASFGPDETSDRIQTWLKSDSGNRAKLQSWLDGKNLGLRVTLLIFGAENVGLRRLAIGELGIP